jgi:hypothetical protein
MQFEMWLKPRDRQRLRCRGVPLRDAIGAIQIGRFQVDNVPTRHPMHDADGLEVISLSQDGQEIIAADALSNDGAAVLQSTAGSERPA